MWLLNSRCIKDGQEICNIWGMKKLGIILTLLLLAIMPSMGQITNPYELTISHVRPCPDMTEKQIKSKILLWYIAQGRNECASFLGDEVHYVLHLDKNGLPCPPENGTQVSFSLVVSPVGKYYTITIYCIAIQSNPSIGILYGHGGSLFEECYTKRQLKLAKPILSHVIDISDELFDSFDKYINS